MGRSSGYKFLFSQDEFYTSLPYCSRGDSIASITIPSIAPRPLCSISRTERLSFPIAQKQHSLFFSDTNGALLQAHSLNIVQLRVSCSIVDEFLTASVDYYG